MSINMNGNQNDTNYRYKMPTFNVTIAGKGNGVYTIINNIDDISKAINHPVEVIMKYLAYATGSNYIQERETITGSHRPDELKDLILEFNRYLVFCQTCKIPETIPQITGNKKHMSLEFTCTACKNINQVRTNNKKIEKGIDIIVKYLKSGGEWKINKGTTGKLESPDEETDPDPGPDSGPDPGEGEEEINPFDYL